MTRLLALAVICPVWVLYLPWPVNLALIAAAGVWVSTWPADVDECGGVSS